MFKKILLLTFILISSFTFCQKNEIKISPSTMSATSSIIITTKQTGNYTLLIKRISDKKILFSKEIFIDNMKMFKHDFSNYVSDEYIFILKNKNKEVYKILKVK